MKPVRIPLEALRVGLVCLSMLAATVLPAGAQVLDARAGAQRSDEVDATAYLRAGRSRVLVGAAAGLVIGAGATYVIVHSGGSNSLCDRDANQDALNSTECFALVALGGVVGAGIGALIGHLLGGDDGNMRISPVPPVRLLPVPGRRAALRVDVRLHPFARAP